MKPLKEVFESRQTTLWVETQNTVAFLRPVPYVLVWAPGPTAGLAQPLCFRQVRFALAEFLFCSFDQCDVSRRPDKLAVAGCISQCVGQRVDVLDTPVR